MPRQKFLLLDGYNLAYRSFHAMPELTSSDGFPTGALHGWIKTLWKLEDLEAPDIMAIFFDEGGAAKREALLETYKANREDMPAPLRQQIPHMREIATLCGCPVLVEHGVEADDLIASAAKRIADNGDEAVIVSADKDLGQCLTHAVTQLLPAPTANPKLGWRKLTPQKLEAKLGIAPTKVIDYLALIGDTSDNIRGLDGVGPKTAVKWLTQYGDLDGIIANAAELMPKRFQALVPARADQLRLNRELVTLDTGRNIGTIEAAKRDVPALVAKLQDLEMKNAADQAQMRYGLGI